MIKRALVLLLIGCISIVGYAQEKFTPEWNVGVGFGPTFSTISFVAADRANSVDSKMIQQFQLGVSVRYIHEKNLGVIGELNLSQQGWDEKIEDEITLNPVTGRNDTISFANKHKLNYIELPLLTHIYFGNNKTRVFINLGPKFSYLVGESDEFVNLPPHGSLTSDGKRIENQYGRKAEKKFDYGLMAGLGFELRTKIGSFSLEGRYTLGLGDIYNNRKTDTFSRSANRVISARLTYYMKLF